MTGVVIAGAGQAAAQLAFSLRAEGYGGPITIVGDEPYPPYQRPPLSKKFLMGEMDEERLLIRPEAWYAQAGVTLRLGRRVTAIDRALKHAVLDDGTALGYDMLALTTGSRVRKLTVPGAGHKAIHYLRGIDDVNAIRAGFQKGRHLAVIGAGYIGLEVAAVAARSGLQVTVIEAMSRCLQRVTSPPVSAFFQSVHEAEGVTFRFGTSVQGFSDASGRLTVETSAGPLAADLAVAGIGILPEVELASAAGLAADNGITVDEFGRTLDSAIYAAGDCTNHPNALLGRRVRLESVQNAIDQAKAAAAAMAGKPRPYAEVPWFWSDQYDLKLQTAGLFAPDDQIVLRGAPQSRKFAAFYLRGGVVAAVDAVNAAPEYLTGRQWIAKGVRPDPAGLGDPAVPLKSLAP